MRWTSLPPRGVVITIGTVPCAARRLAGSVTSIQVALRTVVVRAVFPLAAVDVAKKFVILPVYVLGTSPVGSTLTATVPGSPTSAMLPVGLAFSQDRPSSRSPPSGRRH